MGKVSDSHQNQVRKSGYKSKLGVTAAAAHKNKKIFKPASLKNQIRSTQRFLQRDLPAQLREAQENKLQELKKQQLDQIRLAEERKNFIRDKKIKFFERRKIERRMRRMEKQQRVTSNETEEKKILEQLHALKQDLEYVRFFPKAEKYVPLYCGDDNPKLVDNRNHLRLQIKENIIASAASGKDLEETGSEDDGPTDLTDDDDFFISGASSDEADADDELTDLSAREQASSAPTKVALGMPNDKTNQRGKPAQSLMPPPRPQKSSIQRSDMSASRNTSKGVKSLSRDGGLRLSEGGQSRKRISGSYIPKSSNYKGYRPGQAGETSNMISIPDVPKPSYDRRFQHAKAGPSGNRSSNSDNPIHANDARYPNSHVSQSSNISSNSEAPKRKRKRRPKMRKQ